MNNFLAENINHIKNLTKSEFESLYEFTEILNSATRQDSLIEDTIDVVIKVINAERGLFVRYFDSTDSFSIITARKISNESITDLHQFSSGILQKVIKEKKPLLYHDVMSDPNLSQFESVQIHRIKSVIGVPIIREEKVWGIIIADSQLDRREFTEENLLFLSFFSNLVSLALDRIIKLEELEKENQILINRLQSTETVPEMIGGSQTMRNLAILIHKVAQTDATVLITGESGTGKEVAAKAIHQLSKRKDKPFLAQFCGSIPDNLLESELFGYKKGAFTGANTDKQGLLEAADGGTFFLDEIADISPALQAKLLRVLENREIIRLGDVKVKKVDVRILAATNKDLQQLVKEGAFREDLFYRLNVFPIKMPPLRERREDIPILAHFFIKKLTNKALAIDSAFLKKLESFYWPGNIRQLINVIQRAIILNESDKVLTDNVTLEDERSLENFNGTLAEFEVLLLKKRLEQFNGNRTLTAKSLDVSVRWIQLKLKELGIQ
ncbi:MAG: transcriptional regulator NifA subfamily Fis Family [Ignavibacteria bacterium]|nr:MAG: transcriptional regulator NifA subfamily Fis Family [Ignavibacteria bacterium]KAF0160101.1 MAG: transcriptional regulator NifA subfamily Fis Family [Ignavibacteria bacterium]